MAINYQGGDDVVFNFNPLLGTIQRNATYQQEQIKAQQKERDVIRQDAMKSASKVNSIGLWKADLPEFNTRWKEIQELNYQIYKSKDSDSQRKLNMEFQSKINELDAFVANSKQVGQNFNSSFSGLTALAGKGDVDGAKNYLLSLESKPSSELTRDKFDLSGYVNKYDLTKANTSISKEIDNSFKNSSLTTFTSTPDEIRTLGGGRREQDVIDRTTLNSDVPFKIVSRLYSTNKDVKGLVDEVANQTGDLNQAIAQVAMQYEGEYTRDNRRVVNPDQARSQSININLGNDGAEVQRTVVKNYPIADRNTGKTAYFANYIQFEQPQTIGGVIKATDPLTNEQVTLQGAHKTRILGLGSNQKGDEFILLEVPETNDSDARLLYADKDRYLNRSSFSKRDSEYVQMFEQEVAKGKPSSNTTNKSTTPTSKKPMFN